MICFSMVKLHFFSFQCCFFCFPLLLFSKVLHRVNYPVLPTHRCISYTSQELLFFFSFIFSLAKQIKTLQHKQRRLHAHKSSITSQILTTTKFHIFAASATVVHTVLQPANNINFWGLLYKRSYITLAPRPGSHCKEIRREKED
jgi:hypothetical protein